VKEAEEVVEHIVATRLLRGEEEGLGKLALGAVVVGHLAKNHDDDSIVGGGLGVELRNHNLAVLEVQGSDLGVDGL